MSNLIRLLLLALLSVTLASCTSAGEKISPDNYVSQFSETPHLLLDVRTPQEYAEGHIEGSVNIPLQVLEANLSQIPRDIPVVVYCRSGNRSAQAATILNKEGYNDIYDLGGVIEWTRKGYPLI